MHTKTTIVIVNFNSSEFINLSLYALQKLTYGKFKVMIVDNGSKKLDYKKLQSYCSKYSNIKVERFDTNLRGSLAHGTALNHLVKQVDTPYFSILDADATWLIKDWDKICINQLNDKVKVIGTQAPGNKPQDFPLMFSILFETETFNKLNIDFRPENAKSNPNQDTGWEIRDKYLKNGFQGKNIVFKNTRDYKEGPLSKVICGEYYLDGYIHIFASHFGRGSTMGANKYYKGMPFIYRIPKVGLYFRKRKGQQEKKQWLKICKDIIDQQI